MKLSKFLKAANFNISDSSRFTWDCYGPNAHYIDVSDDSNRHIGSCVFDKISNKIFEISSYVDENHPVKWFSPRHIQAYYKEASERGHDPLAAWDDVQYEQIIVGRHLLEQIKLYMQTRQVAPKVTNELNHTVQTTTLTTITIKAKSEHDAIEKVSEWMEDVRLAPAEWPENAVWDDEYISNVEIVLSHVK